LKNTSSELILEYLR